jgi:hypothetical protein
MATVTCFNCGTSETSMTFLPCVHDGQAKHVCVRCLPQLIHGKH